MSRMFVFMKERETQRESERERERESRIKNYVMRRCMLCTYFSTICYDGNQIVEDEMGGACSTNGAYDTFTFDFHVRM